MCRGSHLYMHMFGYERSVYLTIFFFLATSALPNFRQQTFGPDELASWAPAHAKPLPNYSDDSMEYLMTRTSDILCERVYAFWIRFLRQRFDPPIEDAVQSTNVDWWEEARYGKRYLKVDCLDIRHPLDWIRVNARQLREHLRSVEAHRENSEDVPEVWQWLREQSEQGSWIMECWPRHIPYKRNRINALGSPDTWGFCLPPNETPEYDSSSTQIPTATPVATKEWYDTDLS